MLILSSPSGAGKTTLTRRLQESFPELRFSVSHTTREPRADEQDGRDYHFVDKSAFERLVQQDAFIEWAEVHGNLYGTSRAAIESPITGGQDVVLELERRLRGRASETEEVVKRRFEAAKVEIEHYGFFDYVIVNDDLERAFDTLRAVVLAERSRRVRKASVAEALLRNGEIGKK